MVLAIPFSDADATDYRDYSNYDKEESKNPGDSRCRLREEWNTIFRVVTQYIIFLALTVSIPVRSEAFFC